VPEEFEKQLIAALDEENVIRGLATVINTSGLHKIPVVATKGTASWVDEEGAIPESDDDFGQISLGAFKLATTIKVSDELLNDSAFNLESYIAQGFGTRIGNKEEEAFLIGNGSGKPTGIFNATGGGQVGVTTAAATAITLDEILDLFYSLKAPYRRSASFLMNDATVKTLRKLKDSTGLYIWQPSVKENEPDTLLGRPIHTSSYAPTIAAGAKSVAFGDFKYFWIADREGRTFKRLDELYAITGQVGFVASQRVDGKVILPEAIKLLAQKA
jgi:HK97 family phage major capsid protein